MAAATSKASVVTTLVIGQVELPVGLYSTHADPTKAKLASFDTAGPNGGVLKAELRARAAPVVEPEHDEVPEHSSDPLADAEPFEYPPSAAIDAEGAAEVWAGMPVTTSEAVPSGEALAASVSTNEQGETEISAAKLTGITPPPSRLGEPVAIVHPRDADAARAAVAGEYGRALVEEGSNVVVEPDQMRRGVRLEDGSFIDCTERLAEIEESTRIERMEVLGFIDASQITRLRVKGSKYVGIADDPGAAVGLRLLHLGLGGRRRGAIVKLTKRTRQSLGVIVSYSGVLVMLEVVFAEDLRKPPARAKVITDPGVMVTDAQVQAMEALIDSMAVGVDVLDSQRDDAIALREQLKADALAGRPIGDVVDAEVIDERSDDLMARLEASLAGA